MSLLRLFAYLLNGSDDMQMSRSWLSNEAQMQAYEAYTARENASAYVLHDVQWFRNRDFWKARAEREKPSAKVLKPAKWGTN